MVMGRISSRGGKLQLPGPALHVGLTLLPPDTEIAGLEVAP